jgi:hypothetical protein
MTKSLLSNIREEQLLAEHGFFDVVNGVSHAELTRGAFAILMRDLIRYGNKPKQDHQEALIALLATMTDMAQGKRKGRYAFPLPTGMGKTQSIIAWVTALNHLEHDHIAVSVSASKVEALCELKRNLIDHGVPEGKIGLVHSYNYDPTTTDKHGQLLPGYASLPSTGNSDRQIMLVTHNRVKGSSDNPFFHYYLGKPRALMLYDESLIVSDSVGINFSQIRGALGFLKGIHKGSERHEELFKYLSGIEDEIDSTLDRLKQSDDDNELVLQLPAVTEANVVSYRKLLGSHVVTKVLHQLLDVLHLPIRVINAGESGVVAYNVTVPPEIENILILDASYPIRELLHLDKSIKDAEEHLSYLKNISTPLPLLKRFDRVRIKHMKAPGGRRAVTEDFSKSPSDRRISKDIAQVVSGIPEHESVLIFTYKEQSRDDAKFKDKLISELEKAGINTKRKVIHGDSERDRINVLTWGSETSLNNYNHCSHVILTGILHRSFIDLASVTVGQSDDILTRVTKGSLQKLRTSELVHLVYQAASRGTCRTISEGKAKAMTLWLIHKGDDLREGLAKVMPGANWESWEGYYSEEKESQTKKIARQIRDYLDKFTGDQISTRKLKEALNIKIPPNSFTRARDYFLENLSKAWVLQGRTLIRDESLTYGFQAEN